MIDAERHVLRLEDCTGDCAELVGGKATGLGALLSHGFPVPPGFAVTTSAYREHVRHNHLAEALHHLLSNGASAEIRAMFEATRPSTRLEEEIRTAHTEVFGKSGAAVAVRSSATAEDLASASFAGQQETYLWILGQAEVVRHVVRCWASLFTPQALAYRAHLARPVTDLAMGVVVQQMVLAEAAGVMLTIDPVSGDPGQIVIEASYGSGVAVVNGEVLPDRFYIDKAQAEIRSRTIGSKTVAYRFDPSVQGARVDAVPAALQMQLSLSDDEVVELANLGMRLEEAMGRPQDIEWAIGPGPNGPRQIFLLQARPETVWSQRAQIIKSTTLDR